MKSISINELESLIASKVPVAANGKLKFKYIKDENMIEVIEVTEEVYIGTFIENKTIWADEDLYTTFLFLNEDSVIDIVDCDPKHSCLEDVLKGIKLIN